MPLKEGEKTKEYDLKEYNMTNYLKWFKENYGEPKFNNEFRIPQETKLHRLLKNERT